MMVSVPLGILVGALTREGRNRRLEVVFMSLTGTTSAMPEFLTATFLAFIFAVTLNWLPVGTTQKSTAIILPAISVSLRPVASLARVAYTLASAVAGLDYISSARVLGLSSRRIVFRYIIPNIAETLIVVSFNATAAALVAVSSLSFLGLGVQGTQFDWGRLITEGVLRLYQVPLLALAPATAIGITGLTLGYLGEALARGLNPVLWTQTASVQSRTWLQRHRNLNAAQRRQEVGRLLEMVALDPLSADRYPHQFSGGQRQRIAIARTLASQPELVILDEVVSALDVSVQAEILNLLRDLQREFNLSFLFISHDLSVVRYMSNSVCVMYLGQIVEWKETEELFRQPEHPYTQGLIDSIPKMIVGGDPNRIPLSGEIPDPHFPPPACRFHTRCPFGPLAHPARNLCREDDPHLLIDKSEHYAACHFPLARKELA